MHYAPDLEIIAANRKVKERNYWLSQLAGELIKTTFPPDESTADIAKQENNSKNRYETYHFEIPRETAARLMKISKDSRSRLFVILLSVLVGLLNKYTGHQDIIVGAPVVKQPVKAQFVNTVLILRTHLERGMTFRKLLSAVRQTLADAAAHQNYPLNRLLYELEIPIPEPNSTTAFSLFDIALVLENIHDKSYIAHLPLNMLISFCSASDTIAGKIEYNPAAYSAPTIKSISSRYLHFLQLVLKTPDIPLVEWDILLPGEKQRLLVEFNSTAANYPREKTLHQLIDEQAVRNGDHTALRASHLIPGKAAVNENRPGNLTYRELAQKSGQLARLLRQKGVKPGVTAAILVERSIEMMVAVLAILKAGGAYLPISLKNPDQRSVYIIKDSQAPVLLTGEPFHRRFHDLCETLNLADHQLYHTETKGEQSIHSPVNINISTDPVYVIYTSGSTGRSKGVVIEHRSVHNLVAGLKEVIYKKYPGKLRVCLIAPYEFDASVQQIFGALLQGHTLYIVPESVRLNGMKLLEFYQKNRVDISDGTPSHVGLMTGVLEIEKQRVLLPVKHFIIAGETFPRQTVQRFLAVLAPPLPRVSNLYGPTETCVDSTFFHIPPEKIHTYNSIPIGKPLPNQQVYILDKENQLLPPGIAGELCIGGGGVARGYLNNPELTTDKFLLIFNRSDRSYMTYISGRLYNTGDLARWLPDGNIEFLGRQDHQVKLRGYRIELGEIENRLRTFASVKDAVVELREVTAGDSQLVAYVEPDPGAVPIIKRLLQMEKQGIAPGSQYHEFPNGMPMFYINLHEAQNLYREIFEEQSYIKQGITLPESACVFDLGANIGMFTLFIHYRCPDARLYCFEPLPPTCEVLHSNIRLHDVNAKVFQVGISASDGEETFTYFPNSPAMSGRFAAVEEEIDTARTFMLNRERSQAKEDSLSRHQVEEIVRERLTTVSYTCPVNTLSRVIQENEIETIDLLKIDVEKSEVEVLAGIEEDDWKKIRQVVMEVHNVDRRLESIIGQLEGHGYQVTCQQDTLYENTQLFNLYACRTRQQKEKGTAGPNGANRWLEYVSCPNRMISQLEARLKEQLPAFMIPSHFILLDRIPLTSNGKIHRQALAELDIHRRPAMTSLPARDKIEEKLMEIWSSVLSVNPNAIGLEADFFRLGGHSLRATLLVSRIHKELRVRVPLTEVFKTPLLRDMAELIKRLKEDLPGALLPAELKEYYRLSSAQKRLYLLQQMELESIAYNLPMPVVLEEQLDKKRIDHVFRSLIIRHESFRTSFEMIKGEPVQRISEYAAFEIGYYDLTVALPSKGNSRGSQKEKKGANLEEIIENFVMPFDLTRVPLLRVGLIKQEDKKYIMLVDMHHIISDGVSHQVLISEFMELYLGRELPDIHFHYKDYSEWQNSPQQKGALKKQEEHWLNRLEGEIPLLDLPADYPRPPVQSFAGNHLGFELFPEQTRYLNQLALEHGATLYMVVLAIYNVLLNKISGQEDILVGTPVAARRHPDLQRIVGMFVNTLVIRNYPGSGKIFKEFLQEVKERALEDFENQEYTFEDLVEKVRLKRDASRNPIFDVVFALDNQEAAARTPIIEAPLLKISPYEDYENLTAKFDLSLTCLESNEKLFCNFEYCTKLFKQDTIARFIIYFQQIVSAVLENSGQKMGEIEIITTEEKQLILYDLNDTAAAYPREKTLHRLFSEQVERTPDNIALAGPLAKKYRSYMTYISYRELNENSHRLAHLLIGRGVKADIIVGIMVERSLEMIIGILGILKAGGAYLPLDPDYPQERIDFMLKDSGTKILLKDNDFTPEAFNNRPKGTSSHLYLSPAPAIATSLAYIIYTSGTTGKPKGVLIQHRNVVRLMINDKFRFDFNHTDIWALFHSICFDFSTWEIYGALLYGGKSIIIPKMLARDSDGFLDLLTVQKVTVLNQTPSAFYQLLDRSLKSPGKKIYLKYVILGGEALNPARLKAWKEKFPYIKQVNMYGITETTVHVTYKEIGKREMEFNISNIGTPIPTLTAYVMDRYLNLLPCGVSGELCIGGQGVGRGYLNRPGLTAEKFLENPYIPGETIYRSGDLARRLPGGDGDLEYLGRIDQQVKIRGHRIELGEIQFQLLKHPNVKETLVIVKEDKNGDKYLCSYIVPTPNDTFNASELREYLAGKLPEYMIPLYFISLAEFLLTPHGKIDRKSLPVPGITPDNYIAPQDTLEKKLVAIWSEVLEVEEKKISIDANFFELGGHSLRAASVISAICAELDIRMPLIEIFRTPTVRQLVQYIKNPEGKSVATADKNLVLLKKGIDGSSDGAGHLFFIHDGTGDVEGYAEFCQQLNAGINCWGIRANRLENYTPLNLSIEEIAEGYIEKIKKIQPHGPYSLVGWSLGGTIAFEMSYQLETGTRSENIAFLGLIDSPGPNRARDEKVIPFSVETELNLLMGYRPVDRIKEKVKQVSHIDDIWPLIVSYLERNNYSADTIKALIPGDLARVIPNYDQANIKELIYYLNVNRTLINSLLRYHPRGKINAPVHYFKASGTPGIIKKGWDDYCSQSLAAYEIEGDHFSILKKPSVIRVGEIVEMLLTKLQTDTHK